MNIAGKSETKESKINATLRLFMYVCMLIFIAVVVFYLNVPGFAKLVFGIFALFVLAFAYQAFRNSIFSRAGLPFVVTEHELKSQDKSDNANLASSNCYAEKLRKLELLYKEGLLNEEEYKSKRRDILDEDWGT
jgi:flagellar biosynthesis component FlhA